MELITVSHPVKYTYQGRTYGTLEALERVERERINTLVYHHITQTMKERLKGVHDYRNYEEHHHLLRILSEGKYIGSLVDDMRAQEKELETALHYLKGYQDGSYL